MRIETWSAPRYTRTAAWAHWLGALLIGTACVSGLYMVGLPMSLQRLKWINWHKWVGVATLALLVLRVAWRLTHRPPEPPWQMDTVQRRIASVAHLALYLLMALVPLLGWAYSSAAGFSITWLGVLPLPDWVPKDRSLAATLKPWHQWAAYGLMALIALHLAAAIKHQWVDKDRLLSRMKPW